MAALHLQGADVQPRCDGSHLGQEKGIWNVFSTFKYGKMRRLGKNNFWTFFVGHLETNCHWTRGDYSSYDSYFPFLSGRLLRRKQDSAFHSARAASIRITPRYPRRARLH